MTCGRPVRCLGVPKSRSPSSALCRPCARPRLAQGRIGPNRPIDRDSHEAGRPCHTRVPGCQRAPGEGLEPSTFGLTARHRRVAASAQMPCGTRVSAVVAAAWSEFVPSLCRRTTVLDACFACAASVHDGRGSGWWVTGSGRRSGLLGDGGSGSWVTPCVSMPPRAGRRSCGSCGHGCSTTRDVGFDGNPLHRRPTMDPNRTDRGPWTPRCPRCEAYPRVWSEGRRQRCS